MIKNIHYIWLGSSLPFTNEKIIKEWQLLLPDFKFYFWNESNIKKYDSKFLKQCLRKKAYAFASDFIRLNVVNEYGGFYLDTDMKLIKPLKVNEAINFEICEEVVGRVNWGYFYSTPNNYVLLDCLKKYENLYFDQFKPPVIPYFLNDTILGHQKEINILSVDCFYSLPMNDELENWTKYITSKTIGVHLWDFSWGKLKKEKQKHKVAFHRLGILFVDIFTFEYPLYYFRINLIRIFRLLWQKKW